MLNFSFLKGNRKDQSILQSKTRFFMIGCDVSWPLCYDFEPGRANPLRGMQMNLKSQQFSI